YIGGGGMLDPAVAVDILTQMVKALDHAQKHNIVHRDIKPSNILLTEAEGGRLVAKLTDLGLSREHSDDDFRVTRAGSTVGTVDYMSPEQARDSAAADTRSDLYSLGCTLYHMLTGSPPFAQGSLTERLFAHLEDEAADPRQFNPKVPEWLVAVLRRMMAKKPVQRYQTPAELLEDLARQPPLDKTTPAPRPRKDNNKEDAAILMQETSVTLPSGRAPDEGRRPAT